MVKDVMSEEPKESKKSVLERLLHFEYILIFINTKTEGIVLPDYLLSDSTVTLKLSQYFEGRLEISEEVIEVVLRFKGQYFPCTIPMSCIWGAGTPKGSNYYWLEAAPEEILATLASKATENTSEKASSENTNPEKSESLKNDQTKEITSSDTKKDEAPQKVVPFLKRVK